MPQFEKFDDVIQYIDTNYDFTPCGFWNGDIYNEADNPNVQKSQRVFAFALLNNLDKNKTLYLFCEHYAAVLKDIGGTNHANIRAFMQNGWDKLKFDRPLPSILK